MKYKKNSKICIAVIGKSSYSSDKKKLEFDHQISRHFIFLFHTHVIFASENAYLCNFLAWQQNLTPYMY